MKNALYDTALSDAEWKIVEPLGDDMTRAFLNKFPRGGYILNTPN